jgi:hypothetical protein
MLRQMLTANLMLMSLTSCATAGSGTDSWCDLDGPILTSRHDVLTPGTARQIDAHNDVGSKLCDW